MKDFQDTNSMGRFIPGFLLACLLALGFMVLREFLLTLIWALIITYVTWPPYRWLRHRLKDNATLSAAIMTALISVTILLTTYWLVDLLKDELKIAYQSLTINLNQQDYRLPEAIRQLPWLGSYLQEGLDRLTDDRAAVTTQIANWARQWLGEFAKFLGGIGHNMMKLGVILVTVFFSFRDGKEGIQQLHRGLKHFLGKYLEVYLQAAGNTTRAVVYGLVLAAMGQGLMAGLGYAAVGINAPLLFGIMTALLAMIPMGATLVWVPMAISLILSDQPWLGIGLMLWGFLVISTVDNVIRPIVISGASRMPFLVILLGVLGGLSAFGAVGLFFGPVILSVLMAVWKAWLEQQKLEHEPSE